MDNSGKNKSSGINPLLQKARNCKEKQLPGFLFAEFGDVRCVMASVPGVKEKQPVHGARAVFGMDKHAPELIRGERAPKSNPTVMKRIEKNERNFARRGS